jgi:hypothetical protein
MWRRPFVVLVALTAAGCGASAQQHVAAAVRAEKAAWDRGDFEAVCAMRTEAGRREWSRLGGAPTCAEGIRRVAGSSPPDLPNVTVATLSVELSSARSRIRVDGDRAIVYSGGFPAERLRKVDGRWLIDAY